MSIKDIVKGRSNRKKDLKPATVKYDVDYLKLKELVGLTIKEVKDNYGDLLYLPEDDSNLISKKGNEIVKDDYVIKEEDDILFVKESGRKG